MNTEAIPILSQAPIPTLILMFVYAIPPGFGHLNLENNLVFIKQN